MTSLTLLAQMLEVGDVEIVKHVPGIKGYNVGITFEDESGVSVPGDTLASAIKNLHQEWRVQYHLKHNPLASKEK